MINSSRRLARFLKGVKMPFISIGTSPSSGHFHEALVYTIGQFSHCSMDPAQFYNTEKLVAEDVMT